MVVALNKHNTQRSTHASITAVESQKLGLKSIGFVGQNTSKDAKHTIKAFYRRKLLLLEDLL